MVAGENYGEFGEVNVIRHILPSRSTELVKS